MADNLKLIAKLEEINAERLRLSDAYAKAKSGDEIYRADIESKLLAMGVLSSLPDILAALKSADTSHQQQTLMRLAMSLGIPVKDLAERGVERVMGMRKALETIEGISSASTTANSLPNIARLARLALGQADEAGEEG